TIIEPFSSLTTQRWAWAVGFVILILLIAACGYLLVQSPNHAPADVLVKEPEPEAKPQSKREARERQREKGKEKEKAVEETVVTAGAPPTWMDVGRWVFLAAVPSGLLVAVTAHISTDIGVVPLLWVIPLALYLLTFVIVFSRQPVVPHWLVIEVQPIFIL